MIKLKQILKEEYNFYIQPTSETNDETPDETIYDIMYEGDKYGVIIQSDRDSYMTHPGKTFFIKYIELDDDAKKMGVFYTVMKKLTIFAKQNGYKYIELEADSSNGKERYKKLEKLYKMYGFTTIGKRKNAFGHSLIKEL